MRPLRIGINGLGRIGRLVVRHGVLRAIGQGVGVVRRGRPVEIVAANDLADIGDLAHLLSFDSVHGRLQVPATVTGDLLEVGPFRIRTFQGKEPSAIPWDDADVELVLECTGRFTRPQAARGHLAAASVRRVIVGAPSEGAPTFVVGVNDDAIPEDAPVISNASCTTNAVAPVLAVLDRALGIRWAILGTTHAYTGGQPVVDAAGGKDPRRQRAAAVNIVPTSTGAGRAVVQVLPSLAGKVAASAVRVPVPCGSWFEITAMFAEPADRDRVLDVLRAASETPALAGVLEVTDAPLVSSDIVGTTCSSLVDAGATFGVGALVKVGGWYDNEFAYAARLLDLAVQAQRTP